MLVYGGFGKVRQVVLHAHTYSGETLITLSETLVDVPSDVDTMSLPNRKGLGFVVSVLCRDHADFFLLFFFTSWKAIIRSKQGRIDGATRLSPICFFLD
jgi:hypothetical protein